MKKSLSIQLKAAFLFLVFSLNTIIGFACSVGLDMGFNSTHHHEEATKTSVHVHADGKKHVHHDAADNDHHKSKDGKDNCCNDKVTKISQLDKAIPQPLSAVVNPIFVTAFVSSFCHIDVLYSLNATSRIKPFVRSTPPTIPDIRIAIQSFQI